MPAGAPPPIIEVSGLSRTYYLGDVEVRALRDVNLSIERGDLVAITGASGSGKSTLMAILGCLDRPTGGEYRLEGRNVATLAEPELARIRSKRLGFVFQSFNLLARTPAIDNVALPLFYDLDEPVTATERSERARAALRLVGLGDRENNTAAQLSGGQQQRVAIARALINSPAVLLADEPTGNLDSSNSREIMETLVRLNREQGVTIVVVTHDPGVAAYADRTLTMSDGAVVADDRKPPRAHPPAAKSADTWRGARSALHLGFLRMIFTAAAQAIGRNKMRSGLTMLGVFIGVAALIAMVAVGQGANEAVSKQMEGLGTNMLVVLPGATTAGGMRGGFGSASTLTVADADALRREGPAIGDVGYVIRQNGQVEYGDQNWTTSIQGVTANYASIANWHIAAGRALSPQDVSEARLVAVIGQTVYHQLFRADESPIGTTILVKGVPLQIVGLYQSKGQSTSGQDQDDLLNLPFATAERKVLGVAAPTQTQTLNNTYPPPPNPFGIQPRLTGLVNMIYVQAAGAAQVSTAIEQVTSILRTRHRLKPADAADFNVRNLSQIATAAEGSSRVMALLLATVASISLLVGGIGIMNILLVSVTERTREIGLRMALGARRLQVLLQFLAEALFLSVTGGLAGIAVGALVSDLISAVANWPTVISFAAIAGGFAFSAAVGLFFGYYPARQAAALDPIQALRYE